MKADPRSPRLHRLAAAIRDESGSVTTMGLFTTLSAAMLLGLALDRANGWRAQTQLQVAADATALAAAMRINEPDVALATALEVAQLNLGDLDAITANDIVMGTYDQTSGTFSEGGDRMNAVRVIPRRNEERGNQINTYLMRMLGVPHLETGAVSTALAQLGENNGAVASCEDLTVISRGHVSMGGGNILNGGVCVHGATGVATGGGAWYGPEVRFSATNLDDIRVNSYEPLDLPLEQLRVAQTLEPVILPELDHMWDDLWTTFWTNNVIMEKGVMVQLMTEYSNDMLLAQDGLIPDFVFDEEGKAKVVAVDGKGNWSIKPGDLQPHTIYVVDGSAQFSGNVDISNVAFIVSGTLGVGGGYHLHFDDALFFGNRVQLAGDIDWGPYGTPCQEPEYSVYLFALDTVSIGGFGQRAQINNVVAAAPTVSNGGSLSGSGIYFEVSRNQTSMSGNIELTGCGVAKESVYGQAQFVDDALDAVQGSYLVR